MKKLLAFILAIGMIFSLAACGGDKTGTDGEVKQESKELDYANISEDDLIKKYIKDPQNVTAEEFINLVSTFSYAKINEDDLILEENVTDKAIQKLRNDKATLPKPNEFVETLLKSESPQVRGYAYSQSQSLLGVNSGILPTIKEALKTEKEPYVLRHAALVLANEASKDPEIASFLLDTLKNENAALRKSVIVYLCNSKNKNLDGLVDALIELMNDPDENVRKNAYEYSGNLGDERIIAPITEMLKKPEEIDFHIKGIKGLVELWYNYPFYENTSEAAYRATLDYLNTHVGSEIPVRDAVASFSSKSDDYDEWRKKAPYFNTDEVYGVMVNIIKDENLDWSIRTNAFNTIESHCTKEQFIALGEIVNGLTGKDAALIQKEYKRRMEDVEE